MRSRWAIVLVLSLLSAPSVAQVFSCEGLFFEQTAPDACLLTVPPDGSSYPTTLTVPAEAAINPGHSLRVVGLCDYCFLSTPDLTTLTLPATTERIGEGAFYCCAKLRKIDVAGSTHSPLQSRDGMLFLGDTLVFAFAPEARCTIPDGIHTIAAYAFEPQRSQLAALSLPSSLRVIGTSAFEGQQLLTYVVLPDSLERIDAHAFASCTGLKRLSLPEATQQLGPHALHGCSTLESVDLGSGLHTLGEGVFYGCGSLRTVQCRALQPPRMLHADCGVFFFSDTPQSIDLLVHRSAERLYRNSSDWKEFLLTLSVF